MSVKQAPFLDLQPEFEALESEWLDAIRRIGATGSFILGPEVRAFEDEFAKYIGAPGAVSVAKERLQAARIGFNVCYPLPLHLQKAYRDLGHAPGDLPHAERASSECISLPIYPGMSEERTDRVVDVVLAGT